jgi:hypothetical protein
MRNRASVLIGECPSLGESRPFCLEEVIGENFRFHLIADVVARNILIGTQRL